MKISKELFSELEAVSKEYAEPALPQTVFDYEKYRLHQIVGSSPRLAGATLTDTKVKVLLEQGRTAPGKLLEHHLMVQDNFRSMQYALAKADSPPINPSLLRSFNAHNIRQAGSVVYTILRQYGYVQSPKQNVQKERGLGDDLCDRNERRKASGRRRLLCWPLVILFECDLKTD